MSLLSCCPRSTEEARYSPVLTQEPETMLDDTPCFDTCGEILFEGLPVRETALGWVEWIKDPTTWSSLGAELIGIAIGQAVLGCPTSFPLLIAGLSMLIVASLRGASAARTAAQAKEQIIMIFSSLLGGIVLGAIFGHFMPPGLPMPKVDHLIGLLGSAFGSVFALMAMLRLSFKANDFEPKKHEYIPLGPITSANASKGLVLPIIVPARARHAAVPATTTAGSGGNAAVAAQSS